jgi:hypothetical protein
MRYSHVWNEQSKRNGVEVSIDLQKSFLVNVARLIGRPKQIRRQPEDTLVVRAHKALESVLVAILGCPDQACFV